MKNRKGFTLVELLAVIVILAVLMVIAVPQILNVIESSRERAAKNSLDLLKRGIQTQIASSEITNSNPFTKDGDDCYTFDFDNKNSNYQNLNVKNKEQFTGTLKYCNGSFSGDASTDGGTTSVAKCRKTGSSLSPGTTVVCDVIHYFSIFLVIVLFIIQI